MKFSTLLFHFLFLFSRVSSSVIGIDYGTDWLKVSILKPGGAIETVLNRESKRKTNAVINIRKGIRSYGIEAITLGMRFPQWTYGQLKNLIGKPFNDPAVTGYDSSNPRYASDRGTVVFQHDQDEVYEVEELVAMLLKHCKNQAEDYGGVKVSGAVITVPPDFSQFERQAILDAGDIADLKILGLIHDETAVAISYVLGKKFETLEYHLFYDMGAGSTVATLVSFQSGKTALTKKNIDVMIKGYATDSDLGGLQVDIRIQRHLASEFAKVNKGKLSGDIFKDNRAMARLMKEANRVKTILSANQNVLSSVEGLMDGIDFKLEVSRETLEKLCKDLFARSAKPIETVLKSSNITLDKVKSLVLFGGGARIPAVQKSLSALVGDAKIARNVDGDEAAVLGAVLHAASLSPQYKLGQTFNIKDLAPRSIYVSYSQEKSESKNEILVFPEYSLLGSKKNIRFNRESDFELEVHYKPTSSQKSGTKIAKVTVTGVTDAFKKYESTKNDVPIVKIQIDLNESGLLEIKNPIALFEIVVDEASEEKDKKGSSWSLFGGGKKDKKDTESEKNQDDSSAEDKNDEEKSSNGESDHSGDDGETTAKEKVPTKEKSKKTAKKVDIKTAANGKKVRTEKVNLKYEITWLTVPPLSQKAKDAMRSRLEEFDAGDKERLELQAARNSLETFIYKCKELTYDDDIEDLATAEEQAALKAAASEASDWYEDNSELMVRKEFISKKNELFKLGGPIFKRRKEHSMRPSVIESLQAEIQKVQEIYNQFEGKINETDVTEIELEKLKNTLHNVTEWLNEKSIAQAKLHSNVDPILTVQSLEEKKAILSSSVEKFEWKKRLRPKSKPSSKGDGKSKDSSYPAGDFDPDGFDPDMMDEETKKKLRDPQISTEEMMKVIKDAIAKKQKNQKANPQDNTKEASDSSEAKDSSTKDKEEKLSDDDKNSENEEQNDEL